VQTLKRLQQQQLLLEMQAQPQRCALHQCGHLLAR
jgi:hypothetical protein